MCQLTKCNQRLVQLILHEYSELSVHASHSNQLPSNPITQNIVLQEIFNAEVLFREDCTTDEFIDVIVGNRIYMPCLYVSTRATSLIQSVHS